MLESAIQRRILRELKKRDIFAFKVIAANRNGIPDIIACYQGTFVGIEVKTDIGRVSEVQKLQMYRINCAGGTAFVARSWEDVEKMLKTICESTCTR